MEPPHGSPSYFSEEKNANWSKQFIYPIQSEYYEANVNGWSEKMRYVKNIKNKYKQINK